MKKALIFFILLIMLLTTGCGTGIEKVNIVNLNGTINSNLVEKINEVDKGKVEGFLSNDNRLLISNRDKKNYEFTIIDLKMDKKSQLLNITSKDMPTLFFKKGADMYKEISPNGKIFACNNIKVNTETKQISRYHVAGLEPDFANAAPIFTFTEGGDFILSNFDFYLRGYVNGGKYLMQKGQFTPELSIYKTLFMDSEFFTVWDGESKITQTKLLIDSLKLIFIDKASSNEDLLYIFDLSTGKIDLIDRNVKFFEVSPDYKHIAYVKWGNGGADSDRLYVIGMEGTWRKALTSLPNINGIAWSKDGNWLAYSGGQKYNSDLWIVSAIDSNVRNWQLTQGMNTTDKFAWSPSDGKIAFTSSNGNAYNDTNVYVIALNLPSLGNPQGSEKSQLSDSKKLQQASDLMRAFKDVMDQLEK
jgi:hypothetical protein